MHVVIREINDANQDNIPYVITEVITFDIIERHFKHTYVIKYKNQYNHITPHGSNIACYIFINKSR